MIITSPNFNHNEKIPIKFTGDGEDINPELIIGDIPKNAKSLVLIVDDPDAPAGNWNHWLVWNISPEIKKIRENSFPLGSIQGKNGSRGIGYEGPCPPSGAHRYFFKIFALNCLLNLKEGSSRLELEEAIKGHVIDKAELIGLYR